jgi:hypothetical protein
MNIGGLVGALLPVFFVLALGLPSTSKNSLALSVTLTRGFAYGNPTEVRRD